MKRKISKAERPEITHTVYQGEEIVQCEGRSLAKPFGRYSAHIIIPAELLGKRITWRVE